MFPVSLSISIPPDLFLYKHDEGCGDDVFGYFLDFHIEA